MIFKWLKKINFDRLKAEKWEGYSLLNFSSFRRWGNFCQVFCSYLFPTGVWLSWSQAVGLVWLRSKSVGSETGGRGSILVGGFCQASQGRLDARAR